MMRRINKAVWLVVMMIGVALAVPMSAFAQGDGYLETFDDPNLSGWEHSREAVVVDGALRMSPGNFALRPGDFSDITLTIQTKIDENALAVINYYFRGPNRYRLEVSQDAVNLTKFVEDSPTPMGSAQTEGVIPGEWFEIGVTVSGGEHLVTLAGATVISASDPDPLETGAVLLESGGESDITFDDLEVRGTPGGSPPPEEPPPGGEAPPAGEAPPVGGLAPPAAPVATPVPAPQGIMAELFASQANSFDLTTFLINLVLAGLFAFILGIVYIHWGSSLTNRRKFAANFMLMTITTTFIILIVRSSVALSLGLVGALSIVRFRTAVKEPEELAYLFFAIGIGIGLGDNQRLYTLLALVAGIVVIGLRKLFRKADADINMHLSIASREPNRVPLEQVMETLQPYTSKMKLLRFDENSDSLEAGFLIEFRQVDGVNQATRALRALSPLLEITFMDNKGIW